LHVDTEHVSKDSKVDVKRKTTKEDGKHGHPFEILKKRGPETLFPKTVSENGEADVTDDVEDENNREEDVPRLEIEFVEITIEPAHKKVVGDGEREA
jgi:hypothetical protein